MSEADHPVARNPEERIKTIPSITEFYAQMTKLLELKPGEMAASELADSIADLAMEYPDRVTRAMLARRALEANEDCWRAWEIMADDAALSYEEEIDFRRRAAQSLERRIGPMGLMEQAGRFFESMLHRHYLIAIHELAETLYEAGLRTEALQHWRKVLQLNPSDEHLFRHAFMYALLEMERDAEAEALYENYRAELDMHWAYARYLLDFRREGESETTLASLRKAAETNLIVLLYLLDREPLPEPPAEFDETPEAAAINYVYDYGHVWNDGALEVADRFMGKLAEKIRREVNGSKKKKGRRR